MPVRVKFLLVVTHGDDTKTNIQCVQKMQLDEHLTHITRLIDAIKSTGWKLKFTKCSFATNSVKYLGHVISANRVQPMNDNLVSIQKFPVPSKRKDIRSFLGKINFYKKFIPNAATILEPFHALLRKNVKFDWGPECQRTFEKLKQYLTSPPILAIFDRSLKTIIYTDASGIGVGAILKQTQEDGTEKPVAYFSRKLNDAQKKKKAVYIELIAIREAINYWKYWLLGTHFTVITDHRPLENLNLKARTDEELGDMTYDLLQYDFQVKYQPGRLNSEADCLSRNPVLDSTPNKHMNTVSIDEIKDCQENLTLQKGDSKTDNIITRTVKGKKKIILTEKFGRKLAMEIHEKLGHIGQSHIKYILRLHYHFKNMNSSVFDICSRCDICIKNKTRKGRDLGELGLLGPASRPFEIMSLDTVGGFGGRRSTKRYLHLLVDHFTRFVFVSATAGQSTPDFVKLIDSVQKDNQIGTLLTDQYGAFGSDEFVDYLERSNIAHLFTGVNVPSSNGLNERLNQTLINRIRCRINDPTYNPNRASWATIAHKCTAEYNNTPHSVTTFPPHYLLYGSTPISFAPSAPIHISSLQLDRETAFKNSLVVHNRNKERIDKKFKKTEPLKVGQLVYVENGNKLNRHKLDEIRIGPFPILKVLSKSIYELCTGRKTRNFHISKIIPFRSPQVHPDDEG